MKIIMFYHVIFDRKFNFQGYKFNTLKKSYACIYALEIGKIFIDKFKKYTLQNSKICKKNAL